MELCIKPPNSFRHAGELTARFDTFDPRSSSFANGCSSVTVDLRECEFIRPAAAMWSMVYLALAAQCGITCQLLVPQNMGVCVYLKSLGLFDALKAFNVQVDDRGIDARNDDKVILPVTQFSTEGDASDLTNQAFTRLHDLSLSAANLTSVVAELFSEIALNAAQHSESPVEPSAVCNSLSLVADHALFALSQTVASESCRGCLKTTLSAGV